MNGQKPEITLWLIVQASVDVFLYPIAPSLHIPHQADHHRVPIGHLSSAYNRGTCEMNSNVKCKWVFCFTFTCSKVGNKTYVN